VELIDGYDHLCMPFVHSCVLLLLVLLDLYIFIFHGVGVVCMCSLVVAWVRHCSWAHVLAFVYVCRFSVLACFVCFVFFVFLW